MLAWGPDIQMIRRQLGTALEWPEAKKNADKVRKWGIEVSFLESITLSKN